MYGKLSQAVISRNKILIITSSTENKFYYNQSFKIVQT